MNFSRKLSVGLLIFCGFLFGGFFSMRVLADDVTSSVSIVSNVVYTILNSEDSITIDMNEDVEDPLINSVAVITSGSGLFPEININSDLMDVAIPASTTVTGADDSWGGMMHAPMATAVTLPQVEGETRTVDSAVEIGSSSIKLTFDKGVRLFFPGKADFRIGHIEPGEDFSEITDVCDADDQETGNDLLDDDGDCKIIVGSDLVVWTKHFTEYVVYSVATTPAVQPVDNGDNNSGTTTGGGGGATTFSHKGKVAFDGIAYPNVFVNLLKDGRKITSKKADSSGKFNIKIGNLTPGTYTFSLWANDSSGRKSPTISYTFYVTSSITATVSSVIFPPTIEMNKSAAFIGEDLEISGQAAPLGEVSIYLGDEEIVSGITADASGNWKYILKTNSLVVGPYLVKANVKLSDGAFSTFSSGVNFLLSKKDEKVTETPPEISEQLTPQKIYNEVDFNRDGKINMDDFNTLVFYWGKQTDLTDFSILLYYWTG